MAVTTKYIWVETNSPVANSRTDDIWFFDENTGWLINSNGNVSQTMDGGKTWHEKKFVSPCLPGKPYLRCMGWGSRQVGWVGAVTRLSDKNIQKPGDYLKILLHHTTDGGETWKPVTNLPEGSPAGICGFYAVNEQVAYGSGTNDPCLPGPAIIKTSDGGATWDLIPMTAHADNLIDIYFRDENIGYVVGGKLDPNFPEPTPSDCKKSSYIGAHKQYDILRPVVLKTEDGGQTWENKIAGLPDYSLGEWGWKIQFLNDQVGFVSLENFSYAAILKTTDGGESWVRLPIFNSEKKLINLDLEGVGFVNESQGWIGGWGYEFNGLYNSYTKDGGEIWAPENHSQSNSGSDVRFRINRYRFLGNPVMAGYCSGAAVYKLHIDPDEAAAAKAAVTRVAPADSFALSHVSDDANRSVTIHYTLPMDTQELCVGIWNHFAFHVKELIEIPTATGPEAPFVTAGKHSVIWDGTDDDGNPLPGGTYICRVSINDKCESQMVRLPD